MADLDKIRIELEEKRAELQARVDAVDSKLRSPGEADWEENATAQENNEVLNKIGSSTLEELHEVKLALSRIESGKYGICTTCGKEINSERLEALPFATTCVGCA